MWPTAEPAGDGGVEAPGGPAGPPPAGPHDAVGGGGSAGVLDVAVVGPLGTGDLLGLTGLALAGVGGLAVGSSVRGRREHVAALVQHSAARELVAEQQARLMSAEERAVVAREMHDVVAHSLSVMIALADGARASLDRDPAAARGALDGLTERGRAALADMRRVVGVLRDGQAPTAPQPSAGDLDALVTGFRDAGLAVQLTRAGGDVPGDLGLTVYRIVQESLTNVLRHAPGAEEVDVAITVSHGEVTVTVSDDGRGAVAGELATSLDGPFGALPVGTVQAGRGLVGMRERVALHRGSLEAGPHGAGWRVSARLPGGDA